MSEENASAPVPDSAPAPADPPVVETVASPDAVAAPGAAAEGDAPAAAPAVPGAMTLETCTQQLKARFPKLFTGAPKPLKLRIQADIQQRAPGVFSKPALSAFFRRYTGSHGYLLALTKATHRFNLDGEPDGDLADEHRKAAVDELARRRAIQDERCAAEDTQRRLEEQQRRNRGQLLWDFERTTLTAANFCVLKGVKPEELDGLLAIAREELKNAPPPVERFHDRGPGPGPRGDRGRDDRRPNGPRPAGDRPGGDRPPRGDGAGINSPRDARPPQGPRPPQGGPRPAQGGPRPPQGGPRPPQGGPRPPQGGPRPPRPERSATDTPATPPVDEPPSKA
jgi:hypothetical protein